MSNIYSYMRISTKEERNKQSYARQEKSLKAYAEQQGFEYLLQFKDDKSGKDFNRPEWQRLEKIVQEGDTIVFKEISRFTRQAEEGYKKYMDLMQKGVKLIFIDNPTVSTEYIEQLTSTALKSDTIVKTALEGTIKLLIMVELDRAEKEREIFIKRVKQGIQASEKTQGRKPGQLDKMSKELEGDIKLFLNDRSIKQIDLMNKHSISRNTLKKYINIIKQQDNEKKIVKD